MTMLNVNKLITVLLIIVCGSISGYMQGQRNDTIIPKYYPIKGEKPIETMPVEELYDRFDIPSDFKINTFHDTVFIITEYERYEDRRDRHCVSSTDAIYYDYSNRIWFKKLLIGNTPFQQYFIKLIYDWNLDEILKINNINCNKWGSTGYDKVVARAVIDCGTATVDSFIVEYDSDFNNLQMKELNYDSFINALLESGYLKNSRLNIYTLLNFVDSLPQLRK